MTGAPRLAALAKQERADVALHWLLDLTPDSERTERVERIARAIGTPRGYRGVAYDFRPSRLERRPATAEHLWRTKQGPRTD